MAGGQVNRYGCPLQQDAGEGVEKVILVSRSTPEYSCVRRMAKPAHPGPDSLAFAEGAANFLQKNALHAVTGAAISLR